MAIYLLSACAHSLPIFIVDAFILKKIKRLDATVKLRFAKLGYENSLALKFLGRC